MSDFPPEIPSDFKPRRGYLMASGIIFGLFGLMMCGMAAMMVLQYFMMGRLATLDPDAAAEMESMMGMMRMASIINVLMYGGLGVMMISVGYGGMFLKRWSRPLALTLSWGWIYMGLIMVLGLVMVMGDFQQMMSATFEEAAASSPSGGTAPQMDGFFAIIMVVYVVILFVFMVMVPGLLVWLNWGQDVRRTLEAFDPKPRWTDRQPVPLIGLTICAAGFALASLPGMLMMNQDWMSQFFPSDSIRYAIYLIPVGWAFVAWGSYRRLLAAWAVALLLLIAGVGLGIYSMQNVDWALMYQQMGMPEDQVEIMAPMLEGMMAPGKMTALMLVSMLPLIGFLIWAGKFFWSREEANGGEGGLSANV